MTRAYYSRRGFESLHIVGWWRILPVRRDTTKVVVGGMTWIAQWTQMNSVIMIQFIGSIRHESTWGEREMQVLYFDGEKMSYSLSTWKITLTDVSKNVRNGRQILYTVDVRLLPYIYFYFFTETEQSDESVDVWGTASHYETSACMGGIMVIHQQCWCQISRWVVSSREGGR